MRLFKILTFLPLLLSGFVFPWWTLGLCCIPLGWYRKESAVETFKVGFISGGLYWFCIAFVGDMEQHFLVSQRMAGVFHLPSPLLFYVLTLLLGGLLAGSGSLVGFEIITWIRSVIRSSKGRNHA